VSFLISDFLTPLHNKHCAHISVQDGQELNWVQYCRYLGITVESASHFKCNIGCHRKPSFRCFISCHLANIYPHFIHANFFNTHE